MKEFFFSFENCSTCLSGYSQDVAVICCTYLPYTLYVVFYVSQWIIILFDINFSSCTVPAKPINLRVSSVNRLRITVVWNSPSVTKTGITDTSRLNYYVRFKNVESKATRQIQSVTEKASFTLKANTRYEIQVKSYKVFNDRVAGSWSDSLTIKTNESGKSCARNH